jgi:formylglycine-generating enzyme required for sulfatase activity
MGRYEVTVGEFREFVRHTDYDPVGKCQWDKPGFPQTGNHPVVCVSWEDVQEYMLWISRRDNVIYRHPTEAEWEYAARSRGSKEKWSGTNEEGRLDSYAWYSNNSGYVTNPVGTKKPNSLGLYDMSGNVWELVEDRYYSGYYKHGTRDNPTGPGSGSIRVVRGGSWLSGAHVVRTSNREGIRENARSAKTGFRVVRVPKN